MSLKAGNVHVNPDGTIVLHDFSAVRHGAGMTAKNTAGVGTVVYMAPEVRLSRSVTRATGVYGLGMLGKHMLLGDTFMVKDGYVTRDDFKGLNLDERIITVLEKATVEDPDERYQTVDDFLKALENTALVQKRPIWVPGPWERKLGRKIRNAGILTGGVFGVGIADIMINPESLSPTILLGLAGIIAVWGIGLDTGNVWGKAIDEGRMRKPSLYWLLSPFETFNLRAKTKEYKELVKSKDLNNPKDILHNTLGKEKDEILHLYKGLEDSDEVSLEEYLKY